MFLVLSKLNKLYKIFTPANHENGDETNKTKKKTIYDPHMKITPSCNYCL